ncbi:hypothetical protein LMG19083_03420 [Ralstonia psammae]|uniref:Transposase n=1 Tax=Ralstonia psammae TaxID=3058598 RepID=A0ABM9JPK4_9RALS|nr:hypothetical protein LMG19083_03420 [Ralstonia sp. LMG 19083]
MTRLMVFRFGHRQSQTGLESRIRGLIRNCYTDFGPTLAAEKLREQRRVGLSKRRASPRNPSAPLPRPSGSA